MSGQPNKICVLIPTYNNGSTVVGVVRRTHRFIDDIIVVVDGSTDDTVERLASLEFVITIVFYTKNKGKGYALKQGFRKARSMGFSSVLTLDADGQHYPENIPLLMKQYKNNCGCIVLGSRALEQENMPRKNTFANRFSNFWFTVQTGVRLPDTQTGMRIYPLDKMRHTALLTNRYEAELELLVFMSWAGTKIIPVAVDVYYPPKNERISHFKPFRDFTRISILNTFLCLLAIVYGWPRIILRKIIR